MKKTPLAPEHAKLGVQYAEYCGWEMAARYGDPRQEYNAARHRAGLIDISNRGRIEIKGKNRIQFLHGLVSNDVKNLKPGAGVFASFLNLTGRILADCFIYAFAESFLIDLASSNREKIYKSLDKFSPAGDFVLNDLTESTALLTLQGPLSAKILSDLGASATAGLEDLQHADVEIAGRKATALKNSRTGEEGFDLLINNEDAQPVFAALLDAGAAPVGLDALDLLRLEAGIPEYGSDMDENIILLEAGLERAVSYTKGCFLGQETIAKIHHRGHDQTAKRLSGLVVRSDAAPAAGSKIYNKDGKEIGRVTSAAVSPAFGRPIALAYLRRDNFTPGQEHTIESEGNRLTAEVTQLPFYKKAAV